MLLEYADLGTLDEYFTQVPEPHSGHDILNFWESMLKIFDGLMHIHDLKSDWNDRAGPPRILEG